MQKDDGRVSEDLGNYYSELLGLKSLMRQSQRSLTAFCSSWKNGRTAR